MKIDKKKLLSKFTDIKNIINIKILVCYKKLFTKEGIMNNIGFFSIAPFIIFHFISIIIFVVCQLKIIKKQIFEILFALKNLKKKNLNLSRK